MAVLAVNWHRVTVLFAVTIASFTLLFFLLRSSSSPSDTAPSSSKPKAAGGVANKKADAAVAPAVPAAAAANKPAAQSSNATCYHVAGFTSCPYFQNSVRVVRDLRRTKPELVGDPDIMNLPRAEWDSRKLQLAETIPGAEKHRTSPMVWEGCSPDKWKFIGGNDDFVDLVAKRYHVRDPEDE
ncbi:hypothetical protein HDU97_008568 [Phlyctochytrium planicorne]|nr:hypothetical protein HDU97_008568 [Phlyctochytrium planicorne]